MPVPDKDDGSKSCHALGIRRRLPERLKGPSSSSTMLATCREPEGVAPEGVESGTMSDCCQKSE